MFAQFLIPKTVIAVHGLGAGLALGTAQGGLLQLTLGIENVIEQQSVEVHLEGSVDGEIWLEKPLAAFPQKFYVGNSVILCDLAAHPEIAYVRASWRANRWGRGVLQPRFELYLFGESVASGALEFK